MRTCVATLLVLVQLTWSALTLADETSRDGTLGAPVSLTTSRSFTDLITGVLAPETKTRRWFFLGSEKLNFTPSTVGSGYGLTTAGRF